jgi:hypothetical protein
MKSNHSYLKISFYFCLWEEDRQDPRRNCIKTPFSTLYRGKGIATHVRGAYVYASGVILHIYIYIYIYICSMFYMNDRFSIIYVSNKNIEEARCIGAFSFLLL